MTGSKTKNKAFDSLDKSFLPELNRDRALEEAMKIKMVYTSRC